MESLTVFAESGRVHYQMILFRPTSKIVHDISELLDLQEKESLMERGVIMAEDLHDEYPQLSFNAFQLCLLANTSLRISVQGGATYMNSLFPGQLFVLHRRGREMESNTYEHLRRLGIDELQVFDDESTLWDAVRAIMPLRRAG